MFGTLGYNYGELGTSGAGGTSVSYIWDVTKGLATFTDGNRQIGTSGSTPWYNGVANFSKSSDKYYWELPVNAISVALIGGMANGTYSVSGTTPVGADANHSIGYVYDGRILRNNATVVTGSAYTAGDILRFAVDFGGQLFWCCKSTSGTSSNWNGSGTANPATGVGGVDFSALGTGAIFPSASVNAANDSFISNFATSQLSFSAPSGFNAGFG